MQPRKNPFVRIDGINKENKEYEQLILDIPEYDIQIVHNHDGKEGYIRMVSRFPDYPIIEI